MILQYLAFDRSQQPRPHGLGVMLYEELRGRRCTVMVLAVISPLERRRVFNPNWEFADIASREPWWSVKV